MIDSHSSTTLHPSGVARLVGRGFLQWIFVVDSSGFRATLTMAGFSHLNQQTIQKLTEIIDQGVIYSSGDIETWNGTHIMHLQVVPAMYQWNKKVECWLLDSQLPSTLNHDTPVLMTPKKICKVNLQCETMPGWSVDSQVRFSCKADLVVEDGIRFAKVRSGADMWIWGVSIPKPEYGIVHLCAGAFNGWHQATEIIGRIPHQPKCAWSVAVDCDPQVCHSAALNAGAQLITHPLADLCDPLDMHVVIEAHVETCQWLPAIHDGNNLGWTLSFPCQPFSKGNRDNDGFNHKFGKVSLEVLKLARFARPVFICLENVDEIQGHRQFSVLKAFIKWSGYRLRWSHVHELNRIASCNRKRWLAILIRADIDNSNDVICDEIALPKIVPWTHDDHVFMLPTELQQQLLLDQNMLESYGNRALLPKSKKDKVPYGASIEESIRARLSNPELPLPTLVASYGSQHSLPDPSLTKTGIYAELCLSESGKIQFHPPTMWAVLLGNIGNLYWPKDLAGIFRQLGNSIAVPHAVMTLLGAFDEMMIYETSFSIFEDTMWTWNERLRSHEMVCIEIDTGFALLKINDFFMKYCTVDRMMLHHGHQITLCWEDGSTTFVSCRLGSTVADLFITIGIPKHLHSMFGLSVRKNPPHTHEMELWVGEHSASVVCLKGGPSKRFGDTVSPTLRWMIEQPLSQNNALDRPHNVVILVVTLPNGVTNEYECRWDRTLSQFLQALEFDEKDQQNMKVYCGDKEVEISDSIRWYHQTHLHTVFDPPIKPVDEIGGTFVEVIKHTGATLFLPCEQGITIYQALKDAAFPEALVQQLRASVNGKLVPMCTELTKVANYPVRLLCFPLKGGTKGNGKGKGIDTLQTNDPWAPSSHQPKKPNVRWDQLRLGDDHPFICKITGKQLEQVSAVQLGPDQGGVSFMTKSAMASLGAISATATTVILLPAFKGVGDIHIDEKCIPMKPQQVTVHEPGSKTQIKRLVLPVVLRGQMDFKLTEPANVVAITSANFVEMIMEIHSNIMSQATKVALTEHPLEHFKRVLASVGTAMNEVSVYSYRQVQHKDQHVSHQVVIKCLQANLIPMLKMSGQGEFFTRQFLQKDQQVCHSVIPRFWNISVDELRKVQQLGSSLEESFRGIALTFKGLAVRCDNKNLSKARMTILQGDSRYNATNRDVIIRYTWLAQGFPFQMNHDGIISAVKQGAGQPAVPIRSFRLAGLITWLLGFQQEPTHKKFAIKVEDQIHEVILLPQTEMKPIKQVRKNQTAKKAIKNENQNTNTRGQTFVPTGIPASAGPDEARLQLLESKVANLEVSHNKLADKMDNRFDQMANQLQQVISAVCPVNPGQPSHAKVRGSEGGTGETPPPKTTRHT